MAKLQAAASLAHVQTCDRMKGNLVLIGQLLFPTMFYDFHNFKWVSVPLISTNAIPTSTNVRPPKPPRGKRQVVVGAIAAGVGALASMVTSYVAGLFSPSQTNEVAAGATDEMVAEMEGLEGKAAWSQERVRLLKGVVTNLSKALDSEEEEIELLAHFSLLMNQQMIVLDEIEQSVQSVVALTTGHLPPSMVTPINLEAGLQAIRHKLNLNESAFLPESRNEIYQLPSSYLALNNRTVIILIHLPFCREEDMMKAYRYIPSPLQLTPHHYLIPYPRHEIISVASDSSKYRLMSAGEFADCAKVNRISYCAYDNYYYTSRGDDCLYNLFTNNATGISESCPVTTAPADDFLVQLGLVEFLLYHKEEEYVNLTCGTKAVDSAKFSGLRRISLPPGCQGRSSAVSFFGSPSLDLSPYTVRYHVLNLTSAFPDFNLTDEAQLNELVSSLDRMTTLSGSTKGVRLTALRSAINEARVETHYQRAIWVLGTIVTTVGLIACCYWKYRPKMPNLGSFFPMASYNPPPSTSTTATMAAADALAQELEELHRLRQPDPPRSPGPGAVEAEGERGSLSSFPGHVGV